MAQYMLLIYGPTEGGPSPEELEAEMPRWFEYTQQLQEAGVLRAGDALYPTDAATTVRVRNGDTLVSDGPFAETKDFVGGVAIVECADLDEAIAIAAGHPWAHRGVVEIRPVWE
jgi:hypothetical protein